MRSFLFILCSMVTISVSAQPKINRVDVGDLKLDYQTLGKAKSVSEAKAVCASLNGAKNEGWTLSGAEEFMALLMTQNNPFLTVPQSFDDSDSGNHYLSWVSEKEITGDQVMIIQDGRGGAGDGPVSLQELILELKTSTKEKQNKHISDTIQSLEKGVEVVCIRRF